jgi:iron complex outermembrane receptor protein
LLYAQVSEGFRLGRGQARLPLGCDVNNDGLLDHTEGVITDKIDADTTENFELGGKFTLLDNRLTLNAAIFRIDWTNLPVRIINTTEACLNNIAIENNLGEARSEGVELEGSFAVTADLLVNFSAAYMDAELTETRAPFEVGDALPYAPKSSASLGVQYDFELADSPSFVRADMSYVGEYENGPQQNNYPTSGDYTKVNIRAGMNLNESWSLGLYVNNLLDEDATTIDEFVDFRVTPRKLGFEARYNF